MFTRTRAANSGVIALALTGLAIGILAGCTPDVKDLRTEGIEQYRCNQYVESMATMRHVLELSPNDAQGNYYMGLNYRASAARKFRDGDVTAARRELDTAVVYFTQAVKSWPNYMAAVAAKTEALQARGKYDEALNVAERVADNNRGEAEHFVFLGDEYRDRGDYDNALRAYKTALSTKPDCARAYESMAKLYARIGDTALAADASRRANELDVRQPVLTSEADDAQTRQVNHQGN